jgi:hypothetical protein
LDAKHAEKTPVEEMTQELLFQISYQCRRVHGQEVAYNRACTVRRNAEIVVSVEDESKRVIDVQLGDVRRNGDCVGRDCSAIGRHDVFEPNPLFLPGCGFIFYVSRNLPWKTEQGKIDGETGCNRSSPQGGI